MDYTPEQMVRLVEARVDAFSQRRVHPRGFVEINLMAELLLDIRERGLLTDEEEARTS